MNRSFYLPDKKAFTPRAPRTNYDPFFRVFEKTPSKYIDLSQGSSKDLAPKPCGTCQNRSDGFTTDSGTKFSFTSRLYSGKKRHIPNLIRTLG